MPETILDRIITTKRQEVEQARALVPGTELRKQIEQADPPLSFFEALARPGPIRLIAEVKKASPSAGVIRADFDAAAIARAYADHGATCISVLTDEKYFGGGLHHLRQVRAAVALPLLRKDFIIDSYQLLEARAAGADAVLLIAECLDDCNLRKLHNEAVELGLTPLVELYDRANLKRVLDAGASLVGVNNRNLHTFEVDLKHALRMRDEIPNECLLVAESGIKTRADAEQLEAAGVEAMLVGETLMRSPDIGTAVQGLLGR
ncbi:MAG: indole-3-glycerol phosphate synthase TrpC [Pirellulales bacterium]|nr:indole-3-glycerol phosphate synthase TrpC [Pirellulales bacterium]